LEAVRRIVWLYNASALGKPFECYVHSWFFWFSRRVDETKIEDHEWLNI